MPKAIQWHIYRKYRYRKYDIGNTGRKYNFDEFVKTENIKIEF